MACGGWGAAWGQIPWGGSVCPEDTGIVPGWGDRYQRVRREWRLQHEYQHNVLFKVEGVHAEIRVGKAQVEISPSTPRQLRRRIRRELAQPPPQIAAEHELVEPLRPPTILSAWGAVEVSADCNTDEIAGVSATARIGTPTVKAVRNPTDEELLMMLAELV